MSDGIYVYNCFLVDVIFDKEIFYVILWFRTIFFDFAVIFRFGYVEQYLLSLILNSYFMMNSYSSQYYYSNS